MAAPERIKELIETFDRNVSAYRSPDYKEAQLRNEFIDPFFTCLGWDVKNERGYAPQYRDVIHEDALKVGEYTKAPDYAFCVGGARKFFLEVKRPSVDIKEDISPAFQLRRYAWSARLPLSILTDFEELAVYDCRVKPVKTDKASTARILFYTYRDFESKWDEIASVFSHDAVVKGSFDGYVESTKGKKGTTEVDAAFLKEIESWRDLLARNIAIRNPNLSQRDLNYAIQATIDRIIFLRVCEDRGIEQYGRLMALLNGAAVYGRLMKIFYQADDRYNSGLFHFSTERDRSGTPDDLTPGLAIDDGSLKEIIKNLYYPESPYVFSVISADILGQVYEQFLGKIIRLTAGHHAVVEDKPEVKKAGGVYYTPTYIVDYIVENTVGKLLDGKTPKHASKLRILDPACGSGSFLIGAYRRLLDWHQKWYEDDGPEKHRDVLYQGMGGQWLLTTAEKKRILTNNIYGVDIDPQAVEVTKLSLLLKVLEGESEETITKQLKMFKERALPDLSDNIKCGNSLICPDFYQNQQMSLLDDEERYRINVFDWDKEFADIMKAGGFDAVIGNPPYGSLLSKEEIDHLNSHYKIQNYQLDSYLLFLEKGILLLKDNCLFGMIIPNTWLLNLRSNQIRKYIFDNTEIENIVHYGYYVFIRATVNTEIVIIKKANPSKDHEIRVLFIGRERQESKYTIRQNRWQSEKGNPVNVFERPEFQELADKLRELPILDSLCIITQGAKPFQVGKGVPPQTRRVVDEKPFVSEERDNDAFRPLLRGSMMNRYRTLWDNNYWISFGDWLAEPRYSAQYDADEKIIIRQTGDSLVATIDRSQFIVRDNLYTILPKGHEYKLAYILGLLNSRLLNWFYQNVINPEKGEALAQVKRGHIANLPIRDINFSKAYFEKGYTKVVELVEKILELNKPSNIKTPHDRETIQRQIDAVDRQIDGVVYELYGLTDEEIEIAEGSIK